MQLRGVEPTDVEAYVRMRCDPFMMAELGGPLPRDGIEDKVRRDVETHRGDIGWVFMIVPGDDPAVVAGSVVLWTQDDEDDVHSEIGWMVLPEHQGKGLAKAAVRELLVRAAADGRWGDVHAYPGVTNGPSNGICRSVGFRLVGETDLEFAGRSLHANHWVIEPASVLGQSGTVSSSSEPWRRSAGARTMPG